MVYVLLKQLATDDSSFGLVWDCQSIYINRSEKMSLWLVDIDYTHT